MESYESASTSWSVGNDMLAIGIAGLLVLLVFWTKLGRKKKLRLPPGPPGWPLLGHLPLLGTRPHLSLIKLSQKYGPLISIRLGSASTVVCSSPEMARIFFKTQDHLFCTRPYTINGEVFMYNFQDLAFSPYNDHWRLLRRIVNSEIFSPKRVKHFKEVRDGEILATVERLVAGGREGSLVEITFNIKQLSFDHMCRICFNNRYFGCKVESTDSKGGLIDLHSLMTEWCIISGSFFVGEYIPFLRKLDLGGFEAALLKLRLMTEKFLNPVIEEHRLKREDEAKDFLDMLLGLQHDKVGDGFPDAEIKALLQNMLLAGTETAANTTIWGLAQLMGHPEIQQKIVDELDLVVGKDRLVDQSDLDDLKYLRATVKETFRMYPVVPLGVPHAAMEDTQVAGYDIPKNTRVLVNVYGLGRDPTLWTNPNTFDPDRFLDNPVDVRGQHFQLLPFGAGRRQCPGMDIGLLLVETKSTSIYNQ